MPTEVLTIDEYGEAEIDLDAGDVQRLRRLAGSRLSIQLGDAPGRWRLKASSYVGTVALPTLKILIRPKVDTANLFHLLEAGTSELQLGSELFEYDETSDLMVAFATFFSRRLEIALARGVVRNYKGHNERLLGVRGRVDVVAQQRLAGLPLPLECQFDEYTADIQLNRILLGATERLAALPEVGFGTRHALHASANRLKGVGPPTPADLANPTHFDRLSMHYRSVDQLARMVLKGTSLLHETGTAGASAFLVDMNKLFEAFIEVRLRRNLSRRLVVIGQWRGHLDVEGQMAINPDLVFRTGTDSLSYVADTKYKITSSGLARHADYYQLLAYAAVIGLSEGLLIYCQNDGTVPPSEVQVKNLGTRLRTWAVRLDRSPAHVDRELELLADHIAGRVARSIVPMDSIALA